MCVGMDLPICMRVCVRLCVCARARARMARALSVPFVANQAGVITMRWGSLGRQNPRPRRCCRNVASLETCVRMFVCAVVKGAQACMRVFVQYRAGDPGTSISV